MPPVTRVYTTACVITTLAVQVLARNLTFLTCFLQLEIVSPFQLYFNPLLILRQVCAFSYFQRVQPFFINRQYQIWRLVTTFLFFGTFGFNFLFNMIFTYRYCRWRPLILVKINCTFSRMLEEGSFRGKSSDFVMMFLFGAISMITFAFFVNLLFLGQAFTIMLVYVWARRNPYIRWKIATTLDFISIASMIKHHSEVAC